MRTIQLEYWHDGNRYTCKAQLEPGDCTVGIPEGWFLTEAWLHVHDERVFMGREEIEDRLGLVVIHGMEEAAAACAEAESIIAEEPPEVDLGRERS